MQGIPIL